MRISVIMPVNLGYYENAITHSADNPGFRFIQAVRSFYKQTFRLAELIIISDGCRIAEQLWRKYYSDQQFIHFKYIEKQSQFSGMVRNTGIEMAQGEIICYLDHDDAFGVNHLSIINENFDTSKYDWVYYNDYLVDTIMAEKYERTVIPVQRSIGTSSIAHRRNIDVVWGNEYNHDWHMIEKYLLPLPYIKIPTPEYYVCHFRKTDDFK